MLSSVLFALQTSVHNSTGFTPFHMLYNFDPVLPFEYADKLKNGLVSDDDEFESDDKTTAECECTGTTQFDPTTQSDPLLSKIQFMEDQHKGIFDKASELIKKAQKHQAKGYNKRQNRDKPFEIGDKCLKHNLKDHSCKQKMCKKILRLYTIVVRSGASVYYLMDKYSHKLTHSVPGSQLCHFYERAKYRSDGITLEIEPLNTDGESVNGESVESDDHRSSMLTCQRVSDKYTQPKTSMPKKNADNIALQIVIISSKELLMSSDDSSTCTIDVGTEALSPVNLWEDMDIQDIPIEIVDHFSDTEDSVQVFASTQKSKVYFNPLTDDDRWISAMKFNLVINAKTHPVKFISVGKLCPYPQWLHKKQNQMELVYSIALQCC